MLNREGQQPGGPRYGVAAAAIAVAFCVPFASGCGKSKQKDAAPVVAATPIPIKNGPILYQAGGQIEAMDPATASNQPTKLTEGAGTASDPVASADGKRVAYWFTRGTVRSLFVMNADGTNAVEVASAQLNRLHPFEIDARIRNRAAFAPDGKRVTFGLGGKLFSSDADGTNPVTVIAENVNFSPAFSPKGDALAFVATRGENDTNLWVIDPAGKKREQLTIFTRASVGSPAFSADGQWIYFTKFDDKGSDIWMVHREGKELRPVTGTGETAGGCAAPSLSPDGSYLLYAQKQKDKWTIWQARPDGSEPREVINKSSSSPFWSRAL